MLKIQFNYNATEANTTNPYQKLFNNSGLFASAQNQIKITQSCTVGV